MTNEIIVLAGWVFGFLYTLGMLHGEFMLRIEIESETKNISIRLTYLLLAIGVFVGWILILSFTKGRKIL